MTTKPRTVHLVFKTHLDVGFTALAARVTDLYFSDFVPRAIALAKAARAREDGVGLRWTVGAWVVHSCLEKSDAGRRRQLEEAIVAGDIVWHALPFTTHTELMDGALFRHALGLSKELDRRFGRHTIAAKMTDVPGHTRAMVPWMAEAGVRFLHIGVNPASRPPSVPDQFVWRHTDGSEIVVMYDRGGYGGKHVVPGLNDILVLAHASDNHGPPTEAELEACFQENRAEFPGSTVIASTLDDYARALLKIKGRLPVITQEIGDTWIHGVGTDPAKTAAFCEYRRRGERQADLLMVAEHTWGRDFKQPLNQDGKIGFAVEPTYETAAFQQQRRQGAYAPWEESWREQRAYIGVQPVSLPRPDAGDLLTERKFESRHWAFEIARGTGALQSMVARMTGREIGEAAVLRYQVFGSDDYARFYRQYNPNPEATGFWALPDFTKPGLETVLRQGSSWQPQLRAVSRHPSDHGLELLLELGFDEEPVQRYGCPAEFWLKITLPDESPAIHFELTWRHKQACRIPEALWFGFIPPAPSTLHPQPSTLNLPPSTPALRLVKLDQEIDPLDVVDNGARSLHAVQEVRGDGFRLASLDAPLVAVGRPKLLDFDNRLPDLADGFHFNLYNNIWDTNFPMWYDEDARFRFQLS